MSKVIDIFSKKAIDPESREGGVRPDKLWICGTCGSELFYIAPDGPYCSRCGTFLNLSGLSA
jgi:hypothetical protein